MAKLETKYSILLSSPSDLADERGIVAETVAELNRTWGTPNSSSLELLAWETCVAPSFGSEPQDVINRGLGDNWDIYIGMMHARFGTATKGFGSGTEEEFERAFALWESAKDARSLMFYFKSSPVDISTLDTRQLEKVRTFKKKISEKGGLYAEFSTPDDLAALLRVHVTQTLTALTKNPANKSTSLVTSSPILSLEIVSDDEPGFLDMMEIALQEMESTSKTLNEMTAAMDSSTKAINSESKNIKAASATGDLNAIRKSISSFSTHITGFASILAALRKKYSTSSTQALQSLTKAISMVNGKAGESPEQRAAFRSTVSSTIETTTQFREAVIECEKVFDALPNVAKEMNRAKRLLKEELRGLKDDLKRTMDLMIDLRSAISS